MKKRIEKDNNKANKRRSRSKKRAGLVSRRRKGGGLASFDEGDRQGPDG